MNAGTHGTSAVRYLPVRWSLVAATIAVLAAIVLLDKAKPGFEDKTQPILVPGRIGDRIVARNFAVTVKRVKLARAYRIAPKFSGDAPRIVRADGVWMSALTEAEALSAPGVVTASLRTREGLYYDASPWDRPDLGMFNLNGRELTTALPGTGGYFFDVDPARLEGAHLQFRWGGPVQVNPHDHAIDIDLGLDAAAARKLRTETKPLLVLE